MDRGRSEILEKLYFNIQKIYHLLNLTNQQSNPSLKPNSNNKDPNKGQLFNHTEAICSLLIFFYSNFKYKLQQGAFTPETEEKLITYLNQILTMSNCKFLIRKSLSKTELITLTLYCIHEFDILSAFLSHLKTFESKHLNVSLNLLSKVVSFQDIPPDIITSDAFSSSLPSQSTIEAFNKLNFILKNIKKQIDLFVNLTYKLKELRRTQEKPISSLKIEEMIAVTDTVFSAFNESFALTKETALFYLEAFPSLIETTEVAFEQYQSSHQLFSLENVNQLYDESNKNVKLDTIKQVFRLKLLLETQGNGNSIMLRLGNWIEKVHDNLSISIAELKQGNAHLFSDDVTKTLETIAGELENFIKGNEKTIGKLMKAFEQETELNSTLIKMLTNPSKDNLEDVYDSFLILNEGLEHLYSYHKESINGQLQSHSSEIKKKYFIMNSTP